MARWWIGLLVLLNAALLAWNMGALAPWGKAPGTAQDGPSVTLNIEQQAAPAQEPASAPASAPKSPASAPRPKPAASAPAAAPESN